MREARVGLACLARATLRHNRPPTGLAQRPTHFPRAARRPPLSASLPARCLRNGYTLVLFYSILSYPILSYHTHPIPPMRLCACRAAQGKATEEEEERFGADTVEKEDLCCYWRAGTDVKKGQEVCNRYGYMAPDQVSGGLCGGWGGEGAPVA